MEGEGTAVTIHGVSRFGNADCTTFPISVRSLACSRSPDFSYELLPETSDHVLSFDNIYIDTSMYYVL